MILTKLREVLFHNRLKKKNLLLFLHRSHGLGEIPKTTFASGELLHFWSDFGKIMISPSWTNQMTFLVSKLITKHKELSSELS